MSELEKTAGSSEYESRKLQCMEQLITDLQKYHYNPQLAAQMKKLFMANNIDRARKLLEATPKPIYFPRWVIIAAVLLAMIAIAFLSRY